MIEGLEEQRIVWRRKELFGGKNCLEEEKILLYVLVTASVAYTTVPFAAHTFVRTLFL